MILLTALKNFQRYANAQQSTLTYMPSPVLATIQPTCESESARIIRRARKHHNMAEIYIATARENRLAKAIAALTPCPFHGCITADQVKIVLGEVGNIWPESIRNDADRAI
jgi:hypothetical protein